MSALILLRAVLIAVVAGLAYSLPPFGIGRAQAAILGAVCGALVVFTESRLRHSRPNVLIGAAAGGLGGILAGFLLSIAIGHIHLVASQTQPFLQMLVLAAATYLGVALGAAKGETWTLSAAVAAAPAANAKPKDAMKILDTSVIIDGRICDIAETGFLDGTLAVPQFVLRELQLVADSADSLKRNRGRRGLDILQRIQKMPQLAVRILEDDYPHIREVDMKLIEIAKAYNGKIVTNDFNLNKVAQLHRVPVLNINELANALKPIVLPGEAMRVFVLKEGKEHNQGVAYLDDGTMVVIDNARRLISKTIDIAVTSVLQTTAGKMIFGRFDERVHAVYDNKAAAADRTPREQSTAAAPQS